MGYYSQLKSFRSPIITKPTLDSGRLIKLVAVSLDVYEQKVKGIDYLTLTILD
jgi:hypothetical protein